MVGNLGIPFSLLVYEPQYDFWAVDCFFTPMVGGTVYAGRGIFATRALDVATEDNALFSDQETILDIRESEFATLPKQGDRVNIPRDCNGVDQGDWEIIDSSTNGGGETTLVLRKLKP